MPVVTQETEVAYPVEVSGWDSHEDFFVEKLQLYWTENAGKCIFLAHPIENGTLVFLRLIDPIGTERGCPVAYRAEPTGNAEKGCRQVRLLAAQPRNSGCAGSSAKLEDIPR
jgi:hypothetical protein